MTMFSQSVNQFRDQMASISDKQTKDNQAFKDYVMTEYIDFFRTKNRFNREWKQHTEDTTELVN